MDIMVNIIELENLTKMFKIPHIRTDYLKTYIVNFRKSRTYEIFYALQDINLKVKKGDFIGIIGRNGSGKSTLLKLITGILYPTSGNIIVNGSISPFLELGVGFHPDLSARENIFLYSSVLGLTKKEIIECYDNIIEFSELEQFIDSPLKTFSSGMQVRLAFSVAIQAKSQIFLIDEVLAVGDAPFQQKCYAVIDRFKREGRTILYVSHQMNSIKQFCDSVILLKRGKIIKQGNPEETVDFYMSSLQ
jgi:ABC-type polysaccharide/polyol phosphate transport system ATPase subunit